MGCCESIEEKKDGDSKPAGVVSSQPGAPSKQASVDTQPGHGSSRRQPPPTPSETPGGLKTLQQTLPEEAIRKLIDEGMVECLANDILHMSTVY